ncbi:MAG: VOC family protein [Acidimicrobiia bacterium]|nr:VOC family protein [Acidimicrobiia bacterium]
MLLDGVNHVAVVTNDTDRFHAFYREVFDATVAHDGRSPEGMRFSIVDIGPKRELNVFEPPPELSQPDLRSQMFGRGAIDHMGLQAASLEAFELIRERLIERGAADEFVTDFGPVLSMFFVDPDGLEGEVCVPNPDAQPGVMHPPGTPAARYA